MKAMIIGATGLLGKALTHEWSGDEVVGLGSRDVDIRDADRMREVVESHRPDWIVLAAAYTNVDDCETHPDLALAVNRDGAVNVAQAAKQTGAKLLFLSSDYVFDGKKTSPYETEDARNPQSVYGRSKAEAEVRLLDVLPECCIARTSWLFGTGGKCFPDTILKLAASRPALDVVNDQRGCPTYSVDLSRAIIQLCRNHASGIVHVTNAGECSWFDFACEIVKGGGLATEIRPVSSQQMARPAPRPAYSVLSPKSLRPYGVTVPTWQDALPRYLRERGN
ncbi:MAG TPA: dTDP-4-dehydrorhamnose reductase [Candidatus Binatus sp.]|jgi:dTDP-4-dehydrorhamnose reductase|nr:dTDP-4-dehydrorhamnose reductase [Candidatus Binatus sp.]